MLNLTGKTAFVTGAASGIGLGTATALVKAGAKVMLCDIEDGALRRAVDDLKAQHAGADVDGVKADVSLKPQLEAARDALLARFGKLHILVNNAGVGGAVGYGRWNDAAWSWTLSVNLMAVVWGVELFGPLIEAHGEGGQIVSTASIAGLVGGANPYNVSKYGVVSLSEGLRGQLAPRGIGVSVLCPGVIHTNILTSARNRPDRFGAEPEKAKGVVDFGRGTAARIETGIDPFYVGELVREGIESNWPYIFTDAEFEPLIDARFAKIKEGFDRIRQRTPRH